MTERLDSLLSLVDEWSTGKLLNTCPSFRDAFPETVVFHVPIFKVKDDIVNLLGDPIWIDGADRGLNLAGRWDWTGNHVHLRYPDDSVLIKLAFADLVTVNNQ